MLDRRGGDARQLTHFKGDVLDYEWSPDGTQGRARRARRSAAGADAMTRSKTPPPIVIDRYYFKEDETGYLDNRRTHLYLLDAASGELQTLTSGRFSEQYPVLVAGRHADRLHEQARPPIRIATTSSASTSWPRSRARPPGWSRRSPAILATRAG